MSEHDDSLYRELVEHQQDLLVKFSPEGRLLFVNAAYCDTVGKTKEELAGSVFMPASDQRYSEVMATQMTRSPGLPMHVRWNNGSLHPRDRVASAGRHGR